MRTQDGAIVSKLLTGLSNGYFPLMDDFIAEKILPAVKVAQTTGLIGSYSNNHLRIVNTVHTGKGDYQQLESITTSSDTYSIEDHGLHDVITRKTLANFEKPFDAEVDTMLALILAHMNAKDFGLATALHDTAIITQNTTLTGFNQYNNLDHADSTPLVDKIVADNAVRDATGRKPNTLIASERTIDYLRFHDSLMNNLGFKYNRTGGMSTKELAQALNIDKILVGKAMYNASKEGQSDDLTNIWGNHMVYAYIAKPALRQKTLGFEFRLAGTSPREVSRFTPTMPTKSKGVIVTDNYDQNLLNVECAYLIKDAVA